MPARSLLLATLAACVAASGQSVVSVRSGLIHFSEGEVFLSNQPVEQKAGKFPEVREGAELRTEAGRAEVLLTPGMVLRVGPDSAVQMVSASLIDTRVEFRRGSAVIQVSEEPDGTMARMVYRDYEIRFPKKGTFRIDSLPREFRVYEGEAELSYLGEKCTLVKNQRVSLYGGLETETTRYSVPDGLDDWSMQRDQQLAAENPPPGDLNGGDGDPGFPLPLNAFYGLSAYSAPVVPYGPTAYGLYSYYSPGYIPGFNTYGSYGFVPYPIYIYGTGTHGPGRPLTYNPVGHPYSPVRGPVTSYPRGIVRPSTPMRPVTPARPVIGRAK